ncbi:hypothetical protein L596_008950 [Steinernema carpocapsae]|uniref:Uncharacterized protein n=1 Tax=Steinernema carpocapsae TaxID=34508 RepID=A0A4U5PES0_STECR|nr:hypothetical protein L596_008950 [Steinernema carpocapsae]
MNSRLYLVALFFFALSPRTIAAPCDCSAILSNQKSVAYMVRELYEHLSESDCENVDSIVAVNKYFSVNTEAFDKSLPCKIAPNPMKEFKTECYLLNELMDVFKNLRKSFRQGLRDMCRCKCKPTIPVFRREFEKLYRMQA